MSQLEAVIKDLERLPQSGIAQVAALVQRIQTASRLDRNKTLTDTAGVMTTAEADQFSRTIEDGCERIEEP